MINSKSLGVLTVFLSITIISSLVVYAGTSTVHDFVNATHYFINQGILNIPITKVTATSVNLSASESAQSFVVHFHGGDYFIDPLTIYSYSNFVHISETVTSDNASSFQKTPSFLLRSLPSIDKASIYGMVDKYVNAGQKPQMFNVDVEVFSDDGSIIQIWEYKRCDVIDYATFVNDDKDEYRFADKDKAEIRDVLVFECGGFSLHA